MKKYINLSMIALLASSATFTACSREEADLFDQSAADRLATISELYTARLADKGGEWVMEYYPTNATDSATASQAFRARGYVMLNKFKKDGTVDVAMSNEFTGFEYEQDNSLWAILNDLGPVLSYNSYNSVVHTFSDPSPFQIGSWVGYGGVGVGGDYEFVVTDLQDNANEATLKGKKRGSYTHLTRLPEGTDFKAYLKDLKDFEENHFPESMLNDLVMVLGDHKYYVRDLVTTIATIWPYGESWADTKEYHPYLLTKQGNDYILRFRDPLKLKNMPEDAEEYAQSFKWDEANYRFIGLDDENSMIRGLESQDLPDLLLKGAARLGWRINEEEIGSSANAATQGLKDGIVADRNTNAYQYTDFFIDEYTNKFVMDICYKQGRSTLRHLYYNFTTKVEDGKLVLAYESNVDKASETAYDKIAGLKEYLNAFSTTFVVNAPAGSGFLVGALTLQKDGDANFKCNLDYRKSTGGSGSL